MAVRSFEGRDPLLAKGVWIDEAAVVIGDVSIGAESSVWPAAVVRGDVHRIRIGARTNIQDGAVLHVTHVHDDAPGGHALEIGDEVTVGHRAVLHGCQVGDRCLIGIGATLLDGVVVPKGTIVAAGALVTPGKHLEPGYLWLGAPARRGRALTEADQAQLAYSARHYVRLKDRHRSP